jgi:hypothetical protein
MRLNDLEIANRGMRLPIILNLVLKINQGLYTLELKYYNM